MTMTHLMHAEMHATVESMVAIQVRDVPEAIRDDLAREAKARGVSLQVFLREVLEREARTARNREFLRTYTPVPLRGGITSDEIVKIIEDGRAERDQQIMDAVLRRSE